MTDEKKPTATGNGSNTPRAVHRSPNYPMFSLKDAIEKVKLIYQHEKKNFTTAAVIQKDIGYKEGTGPAGRAVSALKQYGLIEERSGTYGLSEKGFQLTYLEENSPERLAVIQDIAINPLIFRELVGAYTDGLPSDATLKSYLIGKKSFNPSAVDDFIRIFKETIELARFTAPDYTPLQQSVQDAGGHVEQQSAVTPQGQGGTKASHFFTWSLSIPRNVRAELKLSGEGIRKEDVQRLKRQIEALEESFDDETAV
jgi:hypothetical protein